MSQRAIDPFSLPRVPPTPDRGEARARALRFLCEQRLSERRTADGQRVGIQATLARADQPNAALDLNTVLDAMVVEEGDDHGRLFVADPQREAWREITTMVARKLGFPLEPELFSNMLFVAYLGSDPDPDLRALCRVLLDTFRDRQLEGLYHFFVSPRFACDVDCTGMAARARLATADIDLETPGGAVALRTITSAILRSASVARVEADANASHGKWNGPLREHVFKVYLDDHQVQGPECDRGLKNNPVVVSNALTPVLVELARGLRDPHQAIALREYVEGSPQPRTGKAMVAQIVAANVCYVMGFLLSGEWRKGCRYYPSPDAFLCSLSENVRRFPALFQAFDALAACRQAIEERRQEIGRDCSDDPWVSLNAALRAIAAKNLGLDASPEMTHLVRHQGEDGSWSELDCLYSFGGSTVPVHFRSPVLTTAFAVRALAPSGPPPVDLGATGWADAILERVLAATE